MNPPRSTELRRAGPTGPSCRRWIALTVMVGATLGCKQPGANVPAPRAAPAQRDAGAGDDVEPAKQVVPEDEPVEHTTRISALGWSPDGNKLASVGRSPDRRVVIWNIDGPGSAVGLDGPASGAEGEADWDCLDWSPDGAMVMAQTCRGRQLLEPIIWNTADNAGEALAIVGPQGCTRAWFVSTAGTLRVLRRGADEGGPWVSLGPPAGPPTVVWRPDEAAVKGSALEPLVAGDTIILKSEPLRPFAGTMLAKRGVLARLDPSRDDPAWVRHFDGPIIADISADGHTVAVGTKGKVAMVDPSSGRTTKTLNLGQTITDVALLEGQLWATTSRSTGCQPKPPRSSKLVQIDIETNRRRVHRIDAGRVTLGPVAPNGATIMLSGATDTPDCDDPPTRFRQLRATNTAEVLEPLSHSVPFDPQEVGSSRYLGQGNAVATVTRNSLTIRDLRQGGTAPITLSVPVSVWAFAPDGRIVAVSDDQKLTLYRASPSGTLEIHQRLSPRTDR